MPLDQLATNLVRDVPAGEVPVSRIVTRATAKDSSHEAFARRRRRLAETALGVVVVPVSLLALWQFAAVRGWIDARFYPPPTDILSSAGDLIADGTLWAETWISAQRILWGFAIGSVAGIVVGLLMGTMLWLRAAFEPLLDALYTIPKLAVLPIFITMFGIGDAPKIAVIAVTVFFFVWIATMAATISVAIGYREAAMTFQATRLQMFRHVIVPAATPEIFVGLRIGAGVSVLLLVASESVVGNDGLGHLIFNSRAVFLNEQMFVGIVTVSLLGVFFSSLIKWVGRLMTPWSSTGSSRR